LNDVSAWVVMNQYLWTGVVFHPLRNEDHVDTLGRAWR
jgi:hypothetical protein